MSTGVLKVFMGFLPTVLMAIINNVLTLKAGLLTFEPMSIMPSWSLEVNLKLLRRRLLPCKDIPMFPR